MSLGIQVTLPTLPKGSCKSTASIIVPLGTGQWHPLQKHTFAEIHQHLWLVAEELPSCFCPPYLMHFGRSRTGVVLWQHGYLVISKLSSLHYKKEDRKRGRRYLTPRDSTQSRRKLTPALLQSGSVLEVPPPRGVLSGAQNVAVNKTNSVPAHMEFTK